MCDIFIFKTSCGKNFTFKKGAHVTIQIGSDSDVIGVIKEPSLTKSTVLYLNRVTGEFEEIKIENKDIEILPPPIKVKDVKLPKKGTESIFSWIYKCFYDMDSKEQKEYVVRLNILDLLGEDF